MAERRMKTERITEISLYDLEGTFDQIREKLNDFEQYYKKVAIANGTWEPLLGTHFAVSVEPRKYEEGNELVLNLVRPENDLEIAIREGQDKIRKERQETSERETYERLRAKYGNDTPWR